MLKNLILNSPAFWAAVILGIFAVGLTQIIPADDLNRVTAHLARYL